MNGSAFNALFASTRASFDAAFGEPWQVLPQTRGANVNGPGGLDVGRPTVNGLIGIFTDKAEMYKASHVYDFQTDKRPGVVTAETKVEFPNTFVDPITLASLPLDIRTNDVVVRQSDGSRWRISSVEQDAVPNRLLCGLGRL